MARIGDVQSYVLVLISRGVNSFKEVVDTLHRFSIPKSSVYTAIDELVRKGLVIRNGDRIELSSAGRELLSTAVSSIIRKVRELTLALKLVEAEFVDSEAIAMLDPDTLQELKARLEELLRVIEESLKSWKRIEVE